MNEFYCVNIEFYDNREVKACLTHRQARKKPRNQYKVIPGIQAFKIWMTSETTASNFVASVLIGEIYIDDVLMYFDQAAEWEKAA